MCCLAHVLPRRIFSQHSLEFLKTSCSSAPLAVHSSGIYTVVTELVNARVDQTKRGVKMVSALSEEEKARDKLVCQATEKSVAQIFLVLPNEPVIAFK